MAITKATTFPIYSQKMAGYMMMRGFVLVSVAPNDKDEGRNVFYFWDSPEIKKSIQEYLRNNKG